MLSAMASVLLVPPVNLALLALAAVLLRRRRTAAVLLAALVLLGLPEVSRWLLVSLEWGLPAAAQAPQAIVILGGDVVPIGPDEATQDIGALTLERLRWGAAAQRAAGLPVLVTGGVLDDGREPLAVLMARSLQTDFAVSARWMEPAARDTWENAALSARLLRADGIGAAEIVTHPWHMRRALIAFAQAGLAARPAAVPQDTPPPDRLSDFVPRVSAWRRSYFALHEWLGCAWYALRAARGG